MLPGIVLSVQMPDYSDTKWSSCNTALWSIVGAKVIIIAAMDTIDRLSQK